jgi:hypothetical protein
MTQVTRSKKQLKNQTSKKENNAETKILKPVKETTTKKDSKTQVNSKTVSKLFTTLLSSSLQPKITVEKKEKQVKETKQETKTNQKSEKSSKKVIKTQTKTENVDTQNLKPVKEINSKKKKIFHKKAQKTKSNILQVKEKVNGTDSVLKKDSKVVQKKSKKGTELKSTTGSDLKEFRHNQRYFGKYKCENCDNEWTSGYAYKDVHQECEVCDEKAFPELHHFIKKSVKPPTQPHQKKLCGMCQSGSSLCEDKSLVKTKMVNNCRKSIISNYYLMVHQKLLKSIQK